jgi:hypothetical protein
MPGTRSPGVNSHPRVPFSYLVIDWYSALLPHHVIARAKPVAIHCEPENEETTPSASSETRWIAASLASLFPRNDIDRHLTEPPTSFPFILSSRGRKPVAIHCEEGSETHCRNAFIAYSRLPRPSLRSFLAMTWCVVLDWYTASLPHLVIARAKPVAIHCESVSEPHCSNAFIACSGLPRPSLRSFLAMTWCVVLDWYTPSLPQIVIARA